MARSWGERQQKSTVVLEHVHAGVEVATSGRDRVPQLGANSSCAPCGFRGVAGNGAGSKSHACRMQANKLNPPTKSWQKATGQQATLDGDGGSFAEIAAERGLTVEE